MSDPDQAKATQLRNIETKTQATLNDWRAAAETAGLSKHGAVRTWAMAHYGLGYGDANALASAVLAPKAGDDAEPGDPLDGLYSGTKAHLRPIHDRIIALVGSWGDYEAAPKKTYVSLRRKKQFAMIGPKNAKQAELGINLKDDVATDRIVAQKPGGMCQFAVLLATPEDVDNEVQRVLKAAFEAAG